LTNEAAPLRWAEGALLVLDQRRLPAEEAALRCETVAEVAEAIRSMAVRGAPAIGLAAAYGMALAAEAGDDLARAGAMLRRARPTAVNLGWAVERALECAGEARAAAGTGAQGAAGPGAQAAAGPAQGAALLELARRLHREQEEADRRMAELGAERFAKGDRALTHCNTGPLATGGYGTAGGVLRAAWQRGRLAQVWVDETRPLLQGARLTAWELRRAGIPFRVVADSAAGGLMARGLVDRVVVGADRIAANGDVANKVGTYPLAVLAARHAVPFYVAAPLSTIDPRTPSGEAIPIEERDPGELTAGADAFNPAFDVTPAELVTAIFTEAGALEPPYEESIGRVAAG
jgi:methylthioribose-1-phosphate isomerase